MIRFRTETLAPGPNPSPKPSLALHPPALQASPPPRRGRWSNASTIENPSTRDRPSFSARFRWPPSGPPARGHPSKAFVPHRTGGGPPEFNHDRRGQAIPPPTAGHTEPAVPGRNAETQWGKPRRSASIPRIHRRSWKRSIPTPRPEVPGCAGVLSSIDRLR